MKALLFIVLLVGLLCGCPISSKMEKLFTITVSSPEDETITFDQADDVVVAPDATLTVAVAESFDWYEWVLYGLDLSAQSSSSVNIDCASLWPGVHHLVAYVGKNGTLYSSTLRFRIEN
jgi:dolichyl-phosphate-mannose--protein O-mannosyl transferase